MGTKKRNFDENGNDRHEQEEPEDLTGHVPTESQTMIHINRPMTQVVNPNEPPIGQPREQKLPAKLQVLGHVVVLQTMGPANRRRDRRNETVGVVGFFVVRCIRNGKWIIAVELSC